VTCLGGDIAAGIPLRVLDEEAPARLHRDAPVIVYWLNLRRPV
jgi:hypothetical protein